MDITLDQLMAFLETSKAQSLSLDNDLDRVVFITRLLTFTVLEDREVRA